METSGAAVVVPMFNEGTVIASVLEGLHRVFSLVVCVDDGSTDDSAEVAASTGATVLRHRVNLGQGGALQTGLDFVREHTAAAHVVTFDADGQHCVDDALAMLACARESGADVVLGTRARSAADGSTLARRLLLRAALAFSRWNSGLRLSDTHNGLRVLNRTAMEAIRMRQCGMAHASELESLIASRGLQWVEHPVVITYTDYSRTKGQSNLNAFNIVFDLTIAKLGAYS